MGEVVTLDVYRAQQIFDQFYVDGVSRDEAIAMLVRTFGIEQCQAKLLLDEVV